MVSDPYLIPRNELRMHGKVETQRDNVLSQYARGLLVSVRRRYLEKIDGVKILI